MTETGILSDEQVAALSALAKENTGPKVGYTHELCEGIIALVATNTALRDQLAQVEKERDDLRKDNEKLSSVIFNNQHATTMRSRCVETVKEMRDEWERKRNGLEPLSKMRNRYDAGFCAANEIITALESLPLEQGEQEKR